MICSRSWVCWIVSKSFSFWNGEAFIFIVKDVIVSRSRCVLRYKICSLRFSNQIATRLPFVFKNFIAKCLFELIASHTWVGVQVGQGFWFRKSVSNRHGFWDSVVVGSWVSLIVIFLIETSFGERNLFIIVLWLAKRAILNKQQFTSQGPGIVEFL